MLAQLDPEKLEQVEFPLGELTKAETRAEAAAAGLDVAERRESQEACFLAGDDYRSFLERRGLDRAEGAIVDEEGRELGRHDGIWRYTPGQRRGIGVAAAEPLYALRTDPRSNTLVVGPRGSLARTDVDVTGVLHVPVDRAEAKLRYRSGAIPARVLPRPDGFALELEQPSYGVAPGQLAVLYDEDGALSAVAWCRPRRTSRITIVQLLAASAGDIANYALAAFLVAVGAGLAYMFVRLGGTFARLSSFIKGTETRIAARDPQGRRERRQGERAAGQGGPGDR